MIKKAVLRRRVGNDRIVACFSGDRMSCYNAWNGCLSGHEKKEEKWLIIVDCTGCQRNLPVAQKKFFLYNRMD